MKRSVSRVFIIAAALALASATAARAQWTTNSWTTDGSSYSGDYTNAAHWAPALPGTPDIVLFTNQQSGYTVTFQQNTTNGVLHVGTDQVSFDLNGHLWVLRPDAASPQPGAAYTNLSSQAIAAEAGENAVVTFSSTNPGTNTVVLTTANEGWYRSAHVGNATGSAVLNINTNLGNGVRVWFPAGGNFGVFWDHATINVEGPGSELLLNNQNGLGGGATKSTLNVTDGGLVRVSGTRDFFTAAGMPSGSGGNTVNVSRAGTLLTGDIRISYYQGGGTWNVTDGGTWNGNDVDLTGFSFSNVGPWDGELLVDGVASSVTLNNLRIGETGNGRVTLTNSATLSVTNRLAVSAYTGSRTNLLVLNGATIRLGGGATSGVLTNAGSMKAGGTIRGVGTGGPALVRNEQFLEVGGSIGTLTLSNANLELSSTSTNWFEFDPANAGVGDKISITAGTALIDGALLFTNSTGATTLAFGKWNFITADVITNNAWFDNLSNIVNGLTNTLPAALFVGYTYGVVDLPGGGQALQLSINMIPEPSTVLLLVGGGMLLHRVRRRK